MAALAAQRGMPPEDYEARLIDARRRRAGHARVALGGPPLIPEAPSLVHGEDRRFVVGRHRLAEISLGDQLCIMGLETLFVPTRPGRWSLDLIRQAQTLPTALAERMTDPRERDDLELTFSFAFRPNWLVLAHEDHGPALPMPKVGSDPTLAELRAIHADSVASGREPFACVGPIVARQDSQNATPLHFF